MPSLRERAGDPTRVFFLGCSALQLPYLEAVRSLGYEVVATDRDPAAPGLDLAHRRHDVGYTDLEGLSAVADAEGRRESDQVFTAAAHFAYEGAAHLAERLGTEFVSPRTVDRCLDKTKLYALLPHVGVPVPPTVIYDQEDPPPLDPDRAYYLKSDYGKSPCYCFRVGHGRVPKLPEGYDSFYRNHFLLQDEVEGTHHRINLYRDQAAIFVKFGDRVSIPVPDLGPAHATIIEPLRRAVESLGCERLLTKFDVIVNRAGWFVLDIGLDPPLRLRLLSEHVGIDWPAAYVRHYLHRDPAALPDWQELCRPVLIRQTPDGRAEVGPLEDACA